MQHDTKNGGKIMENRSEIEILLDNLKKRLELCNDELKRLPEGQLHQIHRNGQLTYFQAISSSDDRPVRKVITRQPEIIMQLARKEYLKSERKILRKDLHILTQLLARYTDPSAETVLQTLAAAVSEAAEGMVLFSFAGITDCRRSNEMGCSTLPPVHLQAGEEKQANLPRPHGPLHG